MENGTEAKPQEPGRMEGEPKYIFRNPQTGDGVCFDQQNHMLWFGVKLFPNLRPWDLLKDVMTGLMASAYFVPAEYFQSIQENAAIQAKLKSGQKLTEQEMVKAANKGWLAQKLAMKH